MIKYQHFALDNLFLANGYRELHTAYGIEHEYEREEELEQCIQRLVLRKPEPLRGWDLRFLRRGLELSQAEFGKMVDRDAQTVARWEKSAEQVPKFADLMVRARFAERFEPQIKLSELLGFVDGTSQALPTFIQLSITQNRWEFNFGSRATLPPIKALSIGFASLPSAHGPVQMVSDKTLFLDSDKLKQYTALEMLSDTFLPVNLDTCYSNLATQTIASIRVPAPNLELFNRGFYYEQEQHTPH